MFIQVRLSRRMCVNIFGNKKITYFGLIKNHNIIYSTEVSPCYPLHQTAAFPQSGSNSITSPHYRGWRLINMIEEDSARGGLGFTP